MSGPARRHPNVVNLDELEPWTPPDPRPEAYRGKAKLVSTAAGSKALGANLFVLPAGALGVPFHAHHNNEEAAFVLRGKGTLRLGKDRVEVRAGDWLAFPAGEAHAHQLIADRGEDLEYLVVSTKNEVDVVTYPDSGKLLAAVGKHPPEGLRKMFWQKDGAVPYFAGESGEGGEGGGSGR